MKKITLMLVAVLLALSSAAQKQVINYDLSELGLPSNYTYFISSDNSDNLWISGWNGTIARYYNEDDFTVYNAENGNIIPSNALILSLCIDNDGNPWIAYMFSFMGPDNAPILNNRLAKLDVSSNTWTEFTLLNFVEINGMAVDSNNGLWIVLNTGEFKNLLYYNGENWTSYQCCSAPHKPMNIKIDSENNKWISTSNGTIVKFDGNDFIATPSCNLSIYDFDFENDGETIWCVGIKPYAYDQGMGVGKYEDGAWTVYDSGNSPLPKEWWIDASEIIVDGDNNKWITCFSDNRGLMKINDEGEWTVYDKDNSDLPTNCIMQGCTDNYGNLWFTTFASGLIEFNDEGIVNEHLGIVQNDAANITVYPNPASDMISIEGNSILTVRIYNTLGQVVAEMTGNGSPTVSVSTSNLKSGLYIVTVEDASGNISEQKIVINN
ncbi:MAG: T9SS type A sorting domain-containing protein [Bacteroidales bacterium]|nr:T9SS type A sorting domain-containing protein [Bacteroidales bacterium]